MNQVLDAMTRRCPVTALYDLAAIDPEYPTTRLHEAWPWDSIPPKATPSFRQFQDIPGRAAPLPEWEQNGSSPWPHIERIAWLAQHGWLDPITVDVGCFGQASACVLDGWHRLFAAIIRGDATILVTPVGDLDQANTILVPDTPW